MGLGGGALQGNDLVLLHYASIARTIKATKAQMTATDPSQDISDADLEAALTAARARSQDLDERIEEIQRQREAVRREAQLLKELVDLRKGGSPDRARRDEAKDSNSADVPHRAPHPSVEAVIGELERAGRPLHISELMRLLEEQDVAIPGSGKQANLIAHLTRTPEITRPSRGIYALAAWPMKPALKPASRQRRKGARHRT